MDLAERSWYRRSPLFVQNAAVSARGAGARFRRNRRPFKRLLADLRKSQWYSDEEFAALQRRKLKRLIRHCYETVPYYQEVMRERGLTPDDITTPADLPKLPLLSRDTVRERADEFVSERFRDAATYRAVSSRTSGAPFETRRDLESIMCEEAARWRQRGILDLPRAARHAALGALPVVPRDQVKPPFWRLNRPGNELVMSILHLRDETVDAYVEALRRFRPSTLETLPSAARMLAQTVLSRGEPLKLDRVLLGSEPLYPDHRATIETAFECEVFVSYGPLECVALAFECAEHTGLHVAPELGIVELVEPAWNAGGDLKEIVPTELTNYAMPLLRYRTGDYVRPVGSPCPCGRAMPLLDYVEARVGGTLHHVDGSFVRYSLVNRAIEAARHVRRAQFVQETLEHIVVRLVPAGPFSGRDRVALVENLKSSLGAGVRVDVELVNDIPRDENGVYRWVVSKVRPSMIEKAVGAGAANVRVEPFHE